MEDGISGRTELSCCCISHAFVKASSKNPDKVAVIHGCGAARIARELRANGGRGEISSKTGIFDVNYNQLFECLLQPALPSSPPVYEGDRCFTFSQILSAVDSLSSRLHHVLDGGDDPFLVKPTIGNFSNGLPTNDISKMLKSSSAGLHKSSNYLDMYSPKIVGIYMEPSVDYIIAVLSVLRCGEAFLPLDPLWPDERISYVASSSNISIILTNKSGFHGSEYEGMNESNSLKHGKYPAFFWSLDDKFDCQLDSSCLAWPCEKVKPRLFCYLMYTSGSTGKPKGICGTEAGLLNRFSWMQDIYPLDGEELLLFKTSLSFIDHLQEFLGALLSTCTLVIPPIVEIKRNPFYVYDFLQAYSISRLVVVPSLMRLILPAFQSQYNKRVQSSLKVLVLSGELFPISLWKMIYQSLPKTTILNLYGSTEVSGDCTYFDCKQLPLILESEFLDSVPIGLPISNCDVVLLGEGSPGEGEIYVNGLCAAAGYYNDTCILQEAYVKLHKNTSCPYCDKECVHQLYFRSGDFARRLGSGDLIFVGRHDRNVKVNGHRIALEEIECTLRLYPGVCDVAAICCDIPGELVLIEAYLVMQQDVKFDKTLRFSIRMWLGNKLPEAMVPSNFFFMDSLPVTFTGKVDYALLASLTSTVTHVFNHQDIAVDIKKAFCDALIIETISDDANFFDMGGNSLSAAHVCYNLGISMQFLYSFPTPLKLQIALLEKGLCRTDVNINLDYVCKLNRNDNKVLSADNNGPSLCTAIVNKKLSRKSGDEINDHTASRKKMSLTFNMDSARKVVGDCYPWNSDYPSFSCTYNRCNKVNLQGVYPVISPMQISRQKRVSMKELWSVHLGSCIDASPVVVVKDGEVLLFIGSHSHYFSCINAKSGTVRWKIELEGRIECTAAILSDFTQVVIGCYQGKIYFLDFLNGTIFWTFQTGGEVKAQPMVDSCRSLVWCGSYDHNLYALDYTNYCCRYKLNCGGSIYGSPAIDEVHGILYVASTNGRVTAISIKVF
ncbi:putative acyl-activating enzyme 19 isoform X2 [Impatiens glandulifera]|uniref:putative acyl-activating enzyme 19 isoform X2 n=1 Tax=Impatiens glandulifera TaxID=253017 RepID=UPI001FB0CCFA|nr:putative acyl-activating enzyme 19 isoform X2 [Impatiens glandulifera]